MTLATVDSKIADLIALVVFYEALRLSIASLDNGPLPTGHTHILTNMLEQCKTTYAKCAKKSIIKHVSNIVSRKLNKETNVEVEKIILAETKSTLESYQKLVVLRSSMQKKITSAKVATIIKSGQQQPTKAKARAHIKKEAVKHGLTCEKNIQAFLDIKE